MSSNIRSCTLPSSKLKALDLLLYLSCYLTDEAKLDRLIPFVVDLLHDDSATVRAAAVRTILQVVRPIFSSKSTTDLIVTANPRRRDNTCQRLNHSRIYLDEHETFGY